MYSTMVVDDEKWALRGICRTFPWEQYGFSEPIALSDPEEALHSILLSPPDVVFVDIRMPGMSGLDLMSQARANRVASEFVVLSGLQDFEYARSAIQFAAFDYILKPLHTDAATDLLVRLKTHLDGLARSPRASADLSSVHARQVASVLPGSEAPEEADAFTRMVRYIDENLSEPLQLKEIAARFYLSPNYASSLFRARMDTTFSAYLNQQRIEKACTLLRGTHMTVEEIARSCGYADAQYFSRVFRQTTGLTPMQYRKGDR